MGEARAGPAVGACQTPSRQITEQRADGQPGEPFNILFNPDVQRLALRPEAEDESGTQTSSVVGVNDEHWVGPLGIEPRTRGLKVRCSAN